MKKTIRVNSFFKLILGILICFMVVSCEKDPQPWNPLFEDTDFNYLDREVNFSLSVIDQAYKEAVESKQLALQGKLQLAKSRLLQIKDYYIPLTTVRQKIYDSERYFKLNKIDKSKALLEKAKSITLSLDETTKNENFDKVILKIVTMIDSVIMTFDNDSKEDTYKKMKEVGEHVNVILYKGDLVLSEIDFEK